MYLHSRRVVFLGSCAALLFGCQNSQDSRTPLDMAKVYGDDLADALSASANTFVASPQALPAQRKLVLQAKQDIQMAREALDGITPVSGDAKSAAQQIIAQANILEPILAPLLGPVALYIPMAIGVLQAFVDSLPPPASAPQTPPALLHEKAMSYRRHR